MKGPDIEHAITDALAQERRGFELEVLVAVGPSTDDTHAIVERLCAQHPEVSLVENPAGCVRPIECSDQSCKGALHRSYGCSFSLSGGLRCGTYGALDRLNADNVEVFGTRSRRTIRPRLGP